VVKWKGLRWEGCVVCMWERKTAYKSLAKECGAEHIMYVHINGRIILKWILE
jgi:hypothetical protein